MSFVRQQAENVYRGYNGEHSSYYIIRTISWYMHSRYGPDTRCALWKDMFTSTEARPNPYILVDTITLDKAIMFLCANDDGQVGTSNDVHDLLRLSMNGESNHEVGDGT